MPRLLKEIFIVSLCYVFAYKIAAFYPDFMFWGDAFGAESASLLFLPHGVRVLVAWMYGYRSILLLAPASLIVHSVRSEGLEFDLGFHIGPFFGIICAAVTFDICARLGFDVRLRNNYVANWRSVFLVGALSSVINSVGTNLAFGNDLPTAIAYWIGDVSGVFATMVILVFVFRALSRYPKV